MRNREHSSSTSYGGVGVTGLLGIAFVVLKLCKVISWPWVWVLSPFWIPLVIVFLVFIIALIICFKKSK